MARVPTVDGPSVQRAGLPNAQFEAAPNYAGDIAARQAQQIGRATQDIADTAFKIETDMIDRANQLRVDDALNQAREQAARLTYDKDAGYTNLRGKDALERPNGQSLADEYGGQLQSSLSNIAAGLGNDRQRQAFSQRAAALQQQFNERLMVHENNEFRTYAASVREGTIANQLNEIGRNYNNPAAIDESVNSIRAATYDIARMQGKSAEWAEAQVRRQVSNAHFTAINAALQNGNALYADGYMKKYADQMDANDILRANGLITKEADLQIGTAAAAQAMAGYQSNIAPTDFGRLSNLVIGRESGGRQFGADGKPLTSSAGAVGIAQVLPSTGPEAAKLAGLPWDEEKFKNDPAYNRALGEAYLQEQLRVFQGNVPQGLAAYNAGPGAVKAAIREANKNGTPAQWLSYLPKETRDYVPAIMSRYQSGGGTPQRPTLEDVHRSIDAALGPGASAERRRIAREAGTRLFEDQTKAIKQREDEAVAAAQAALVQNGGNFAALPNDLRAAIPPGQFDNIMTFAGKIAGGVPVQTNWDLYYALKRDPQVLAGTNLGALRDKLGDTEFKQLINEQQDIRQGKTDDLTRLRNGKDVLNQMMREAGIDPTPKDTDKEGAAVVGRIWNAFENRVREREQATGKKLSTDEQKAIAGQLFSTVQIDRSLWFNKDAPAAAVGPAQRVAVPDTDRKQIIEALRARGRPVTDDAIQSLYRQRRGIVPLGNNG